MNKAISFLLALFVLIGFISFTNVGDAFAVSPSPQPSNQQPSANAQGEGINAQDPTNAEKAQEKDASQKATGATGGSATKDAICEGIGLTGGDCDSGDSTAPNLVKTIINVFSWIVGAIAVIMLIFAGFKYVTAGGDTNKVSAAKNTILYAVVGLVVVALSQVIVNFVLFSANKAASGGTSAGQPKDSSPAEP